MQVDDPLKVFLARIPNTLMWRRMIFRHGPQMVLGARRLWNGMLLANCEEMIMDEGSAVGSLPDTVVK